MDHRSFDALAKSLSSPASRRSAVAALFAALGLGAGDADAKPDDEGKGGGRPGGKGHGRNRGNGHGNGRNRKGKRCDPKPDSEVCAGWCGPRKNNCGRTVRCPDCTCGTGCGECATCDKQTDRCEPRADGLCCDAGAGSCLAGVCEPCADCAACGGGGCAPSASTDGNACAFGGGGVCAGGACVECDGDGDCGVGRVCCGNACVDGTGCCDGDGDCGACESCQRGGCVPKDEGAACDDGDACTVSTCQGGACVSAPACANGGTCDPQTGACDCTDATACPTNTVRDQTDCSCRCPEEGFVVIDGACFRQFPTNSDCVNSACLCSCLNDDNLCTSGASWACQSSAGCPNAGEVCVANSGTGRCVRPVACSA